MAGSPLPMGLILGQINWAWSLGARFYPNANLSIPVCETWISNCWTGEPKLNCIYFTVASYIKIKRPSVEVKDIGTTFQRGMCLLISHLHEGCVPSTSSTTCKKVYTCLSSCSHLLVNYVPCRKVCRLPKMTILLRCSRYSGKVMERCRRCSSL